MTPQKPSPRQPTEPPLPLALLLLTLLAACSSNKPTVVTTDCKQLPSQMQGIVKLLENCEGSQDHPIEPLTVEEPGTIFNGNGHLYALASETRAPVITVTAPNVQIRNITLKNGLAGIKVEPGASVLLANVHTTANDYGLVFGDYPSTKALPPLKSSPQQDKLGARGQSSSPWSSGFFIRSARAEDSVACPDNNETPVYLDSNHSYLCGTTNIDNASLAGLVVNNNQTVTVLGGWLKVSGRTVAIGIKSGTLHVTAPAHVSVVQPYELALLVRGNSTLSCENDGMQLEIPPPRRPSSEADSEADTDTYGEIEKCTFPPPPA